MTSYIGVCVVRLSNGEIFNVQVKDPAGNGMVLTPQEYQHRQINPPLNQLPDCSSLKAP